MGTFSGLIIPQLMLMLYFQLENIKPLSGKEKLLSKDLGLHVFHHITLRRDQERRTIFFSAENRVYKLSPDLQSVMSVTTSWDSNIKNIFENSELIAGGGDGTYYDRSNTEVSNTEICKFYQQCISWQARENCKDHPIIQFNEKPNLNNDNILISFQVYPCGYSHRKMLFDVSVDTNGKFDIDFWSGRGRLLFWLNDKLVNFVYGFSSGKYKYILGTRHTQSSYLSRICYDNTSFSQGYTEIPVECRSSDNQTYNLLRVAQIGKPNPHLAKLMNIDFDDDVLFGVFSRTQSEVLLNAQNNLSALCIYSLKAIDEKFIENIQNCYRGNGYFGWYGSDLKQCTKRDQKIDSNFCSSEINMPLAGNIPVSVSPSVIFNSLPTAIVTRKRENHNDIFMGTETGEVMKIVNNINNWSWEADLLFKERLPIHSDLLLSSDNDYLYTVKENCWSEIKIPIDSISSTHNQELMDYYIKCPHSPPPLILSFWPEKGPLEGGTNVTIEIESLGCEFEDINLDIKVAGVVCKPCKELYIQTKSITCGIKKSTALHNDDGPVIIYVNKEPIVSNQNFKFVDPKILEITPHSGPTYGGRVLTIKGENLDAGKLIEVFIGDVLCLIFSLTSEVIKCITNSSSEKEANVIVKFDQNIRNLINETYKYVKDHQRDEKGFNIQPKGIPAGGATILIHNVTQIPTLQHLIFQAHDEHHTYNSSCQIYNDSIIACPSPYMPDFDNDSINETHPKEMNFSLINNAIGGHVQIAENQSFKFLVYPNLEFYYFLNTSIRYNEYYSIIIFGNNIDKACQKSDIKVKVGNYTCELLSLDHSQVICNLPKNPFKNVTNNKNNQQYEDILTMYDFITISIGSHFHKDIPKQNIQIISQAAENNYSILKIVICAIAIGVIFFIVILIFYLIFRGERMTELSTLNQKLQHQVNIMGMEAIATKQWVKRVIIQNQISVDENTSKILKLPEVEIESTQVLRFGNETSVESKYLLPYDDKWEFPKNNLTLGRCLGEGEFGKVIQGEAKNILKENITTTVAVKMLKDEHSDEDMIDLVSEMEIMKLLGVHNNVLQLLGCCTKDDVLFVITEYAKYGNLREFLRKQLSNGEITAVNISHQRLVTFALQVAQGMEYLASVKCIHRDLAARNVLVSENYDLKIADFGLARDVKNEEYYRKRTDGRLPVKWMAPESLCHSVYSTQSDVWSYGILLWEIFTFGGTPYPSLQEVEKLYQILHSGYRMEKPTNCSVNMYNLMHKCWNFLPSDRPTFSEIVQNLEEILSSHKIQLNASGRPSFSAIVQNLDDTLLRHKTLARSNVYWPERNYFNVPEEETNHLLE